jgi:hypothetical protein
LKALSPSSPPFTLLVGWVDLVVRHHLPSLPQRQAVLVQGTPLLHLSL